MCVGYLFTTQHREKGNSCKAGVIFHAMLQRWPWFSWEGGKHITWETPAPTFSLITSRQSLFLHLWNAALDLYGMRSQVLWLNLGSFDEYHCTSQRCIWLITYPRRGRSLIGRDTAQQLRGRPVRWQNKSTLSLWFLSLHFVSLSLSSCFVVVGFVLFFLWFTLSLISTHCTWITSFLWPHVPFVYFNFPFCFIRFVLLFFGKFFFCFYLLVSVCWKGALRTWLKQCVRGKKIYKCHGEEICLFSLMLRISLCITRYQTWYY